MAELHEKYINPFTDFGFKRLFGEEPNKDLLLDFLNEILKDEQGQITDLTYLKTEKLGITEQERKAIFDLYYENEKGEKFIVEMPKFNKSIDELETHFEKWLYILKNLHKLDRLPIKLKEQVFEKVFEVAEIAKFTREEYLSYEDSLKYYRDLKNSLDTAKNERTLEIAKNGIKEGYPLDMISKMTGLPIEQIEKLRN